METDTAYAGSSYDLDYVFDEIEDLKPETKYHYRVVAENDAGVTIGPDRVFLTAGLERLEPATSGHQARGAGGEQGAGARVRQDGRGRRRRHRALQGAGRRLARARAGRGASGGRCSGRAPRDGQPEDRRLPGSRSGRSLRRWRVLGPPAPQGLRTRGRLPPRRQLRRAAAGLRAAPDRAPPRRPARARCGGSGDATAAAASEAMGATATRRCAAPAG